VRGLELRRRLHRTGISESSLILEIYRLPAAGDIRRVASTSHGRRGDPARDGHGRIAVEHDECGMPRWRASELIDEFIMTV
jgi:hypothetical protein